MAELLKLAERAEAATGTDRDLDFEILCAVDHRAVYTGPIQGDRAFTTSLDAAMTLLPKGCGFYVDNGAHGLSASARILCAGAHVGHAATPALALCAAALRVLATVGRHNIDAGVA